MNQDGFKCKFSKEGMFIKLRKLFQVEIIDLKQPL